MFLLKNEFNSVKEVEKFCKENFNGRFQSYVNECKTKDLPTKMELDFIAKVGNEHFVFEYFGYVVRCEIMMVDDHELRVDTFDDYYGVETLEEYLKDGSNKPFVTEWEDEYVFNELIDAF